MRCACPGSLHSMPCAVAAHHPQFSEEMKRKVLEYAVQVDAMEKQASIKMDALNKQLEANRTAKERAAAAKEEAMAAAALVEAETNAQGRS